MEPLKKLVVHGTKESNKDGSVVTYTLESSNRDTSNRQEIALEGTEQLLELTLNDADGTTWIVDQTTIHELFPEMDPALPNSSQHDGDQTGFVLPGSMDSPATERGIVGKIALKLLTVITKKKAVSAGVGKIAVKLEDKNLLNNLPEDPASPIRKELSKRGFPENGAKLFTVDAAFEFGIFDRTKAKPEEEIKKPYFLFIHGTNSDTLGAFGDLKNTGVWKTLVKNYEERVIAFQHRTLTESLLENVLKLAKLLPDKATVHIISHSRGVIVGDILNRYSSENKNAKGFSEIHINLLNEEGRTDDVKHIKALNTLFK